MEVGGAGRSRVEMDEGGEVGVGGWVEGGLSVNVSTTVCFTCVDTDYLKDLFPNFGKDHLYE